jgi:hypothetical protein
MFSLKEKTVKDVKIATYIKEMVTFKLKSVIVHEALSISMLIEHDCLC